MIQINLVPEVKLNLIKAQRHRRMIISGVTIAIAAAVAITVLLGIYVFLIQKIQVESGAEAITKSHRTFIEIPDVNKSVTIANQIDNIDTTHENKNMTSRIFDVLAVASSKGTDNSVSATTIDVDTLQKTITITGQTDVRGFEAADVFRKNMEAMEVYYVPMNQDGTYNKSDTSQEPFLLASEVNLSDLSLGRNGADGQQRVTFKLSVIYDDLLFSPQIHILKIKGLGKGNVTDSYSGLPQSLFTSDDSSQVDAKDEN